MDKYSTTTTTPAPSVVRDAIGRERIKALAAAAAYTVQGECLHCDGTGRSSEATEKTVHAFTPDGYGADWVLSDLLAAIDRAKNVTWAWSWTGYDLELVDVDGTTYRFQVKRPEQTEAAA